MCIRTHDRPARLRGAIASALAQTRPPDEVVVSDDGATSSAAVVRAFADPRIRHVRPAAGGPAANLRSALNAARGDVLAVLDDDDRWDPAFLAAALAPLERDPELGVSFTNFSLVAGDRRMPRAASVAPGRHDRILTELLGNMPLAASAAVLRRSVWEQVDSQPALGDDVLGATPLWLRAAAGGWPFYFVPEWLVDQHLHSGQMSWGPAVAPRELALMERLRFDDPEAERLRRTRMARVRLRLAARALRGGRPRDAAAGVRAARADLGRPLRMTDWPIVPALRSRVMQATFDHPELLARLRGIWLRMRPGP